MDENLPGSGPKVQRWYVGISIVFLLLAMLVCARVVKASPGVWSGGTWVPDEGLTVDPKNENSGESYSHFLLLPPTETPVPRKDVHACPWPDHPDWCGR